MDQHGAWQLTDDTGKCAGYLRLTLNGRRVCDFFPFARDADEAWIRKQARLIVDTMNATLSVATGDRGDG